MDWKNPQMTAPRRHFALPSSPLAAKRKGRRYGESALMPARQQPRHAKTRVRSLASGLAAAMLSPTLCAAQVAHDSPIDAAGSPKASIATTLFPPSGDPGGERARLGARGITYEIFYTNDTLANVSGGLKRGTINQGKLEGALSVDLGKLIGAPDLRFFANAFQIDNTGRMRRDYVGGLNTVAAIEGYPTLRLSELWLEQAFPGANLSVRFGQLAADTEFFFSDVSAVLLQSDWPTIAAQNLPRGGPAYPLSTPGVRLKYEPSRNVAVLVAVFNGDPAGPGEGEKVNPHGLNFRISDPPFLIGEAQFRRNHGKADTGLASTLKLGAWGHAGSFDDQRFARDGGLLAAGGAGAVAARHAGNFGLYGILDQQLYRLPGGGPDSGISMFLHTSLSPSDRNSIGFYLDGGVVMAGLVRSRPDDKLGLGFVYAQFSDALRAADQDRVRLSGLPGVIRDYELTLEASYQAQIVPGLKLQPAIAQVLRPNGDAARNATVLGLRTLIQY